VLGTEWVLFTTQEASSATFEFIESSGIIRSEFYKFKYLAINPQGVGEFSDVTTIQASARPAQLEPLDISHAGIVVNLIWTETSDTHGTPVTSYTIEILQNDALFSVPGECDGSDAGIFGSRQCQVSMSAFRSSPYLLPLGTMIQGQVYATNLKGVSDASPLNTFGAVVQDVPQEAPVLIRNEATDASNIALDWTLLVEGLATGFKQIDGYKLYWDSTGTQELRQQFNDKQILSYSETTVVLGKIYTFQISAFNLYGEGPLSTPLSLIAARVPDAPTDVRLVHSDQTAVAITWTEEYNGGDAITSYRIYWDQGFAEFAFSGQVSAPTIDFVQLNVEAGEWY